MPLDAQRMGQFAVLVASVVGKEVKGYSRWGIRTFVLMGRHLEVAQAVQRSDTQGLVEGQVGSWNQLVLRFGPMFPPQSIHPLPEQLQVVPVLRVPPNTQRGGGQGASLLDVDLQGEH